MNSKKEICIGMAGVGRAAQLHEDALLRYTGVPFCNKYVIARNQEKCRDFAKKYGFVHYGADFDSMLKDEEIDVIDICTPPYIHEEMILKALANNKHVICEKPLCGYFGEQGDIAPIGKTVSKAKMYDTLLQKLDKMQEIVRKSGKHFMYAENFIYAPAVNKAAQIISAKHSKILYAKGEESLKGSSSPVAGSWCKTGGGSFIRTGAHPLCAILYLKRIEAKARGESIRVQSVFADTTCVTPNLTAYEHRHIASAPEDVEDCATVILTFSDGTRAVVIANDMLLGGSKNYVELYCNDATIYCKLTMNDMLETYFLDEDGLSNVEISEMLPSKLGWNKPFLEDEIIRGYTDEMRDFMEAIYFDRKPKSGFSLAYDTVKLVYAAYKSAELGVAVKL